MMHVLRQGNPLCELIFNFAFSPIIKAFHTFKGLTVLVFADGILIIADTPEFFHTALGILKFQYAKLTLTINGYQRRTIYLSLSPRECCPTLTFLNGVPIEYVLEFDEIMFWSKPVGLQLMNDHHNVKVFYGKTVIIRNLDIIPWHKLDALKSFYFSSLQCALIRLQKWTDLI